MTPQRFVYFIRPVGKEGPVKIGCSEAPLRRLDNLMCWSPMPLEVAATVPGSFDLERNIHEVLMDLHSHHEWFRADGRLTAIISALRAGKPIGEAMDLNAPRTPLGKKALHWAKHPENRVRTRYAMKLTWAQRRMRTATHYFSLSDADEAILVRWRGYGQGYRAAPISPTAEELARFDAIIADPAKHLIGHSLFEYAA